MQAVLVPAVRALNIRYAHVTRSVKIDAQYPEPFVASLSNHERLRTRIPALRQAQGERLFVRHHLVAAYSFRRNRLRRPARFG
jgi:hypothetical protein